VLMSSNHHQVLAVGGAVAAAVCILQFDRLRGAWRRLTNQVKLTYFDIDGLGEPIRYVLAISQVPFEDFRFAKREDFIAVKPKLRFGQVPCLEVEGEEYFQSASIMRFIAKHFASPLYPTNAKAAAAVDSLLEQIKDMDIGKGVASYKRRFGIPESVLNDDNAELCFDLWKSETMPRHLHFLETAASESVTMWIAGTAGPSIADVFLATQLNSYRKKWPDLPRFPTKLQAIVDAVYALPAVVEFRAK